jgi:hypothetical protein
MFILRAKPQNRTEVSSTTMKRSTVELELPVVDSKSILMILNDIETGRT